MRAEFHSKRSLAGPQDFPNGGEHRLITRARKLVRAERSVFSLMCARNSDTGAGISRKRVLVVNDDARLAHSVVALLADSGYDVRVAYDGLEALNILSYWRVDLVLLDLFMPRCDGWSFLARLSSRPASERPRVLVWSVAGADELDRARSLGAAVCPPSALTEPGVLLSTIDSVIRGSIPGD
jgi:CheY-like chemotaxis protein